MMHLNLSHHDQIGEMLRKLRVDAGLTTRDLAQKLGLRSASTISHYETGQRQVSLETLAKLAKIYKAKFVIS
jgi:transcriptional regulator with XRE-family HTH domain